MTKRILLCCSMLVLFVSIDALAADGRWEKIKERDGVLVFRRKQEDSALVAFRGEGRVAYPLVRVASVLFDPERATEWVADLAETRIIKWFSATEYMEFDHVRTPPVLRDREFLSRVKIEPDPEHRQIKFTFMNPAPDEVPEELKKPVYIRGQLNGTCFTLTGSEDGQSTFVEGEVYADPMGSVPKWIVNLFQQDWPLDSFHAMNKQLAKSDIKDHPKIVELMKPATVVSQK